jgi:hypothetical protein
MSISIQLAHPNKIPHKQDIISAERLVSRIGSNIYCDVCGKNPANAIFFSTHIHDGCYKKQHIKISVRLDNKVRMKQGFNITVMYCVYSFYICKECFPNADKYSALEFCPICQCLTICPVCYLYQSDEAPVYYNERCEAIIKCQSCFKLYMPSKNSVKLLEKKIVIESAQKLSHRIYHNIMCDICGRYQANAAFISKHVHDGCSKKQNKKINIMLDDNMTSDVTLVKDMYHFYICLRCRPDIKKCQTMHFCVLCENLTICPKCYQYQYSGLTTFDDAVLQCYNCYHKYMPSKNSLHLLD